MVRHPPKKPSNAMWQLAPAESHTDNDLPERRLSRQESKLATRQRLLQAALEVLIDRGREALTTSSVTKRIGIAQPTFYVHFHDMEELLCELASNIVDRLRVALKDARAPLRGSVDMVTAHETYRMTLRAIVEHADLLRVFLAEQYHPNSTLGTHAQQLLSALTDDLRDDLATTPLALGLSTSQLQLVSETFRHLILQIGLGLADKHLNDEDAAIDMLSHTLMALVASLPREPVR